MDYQIKRTLKISCLTLQWRKFYNALHDIFVVSDINSESTKFMFPNEAQTRKQLIDGQIAKAGWDLFDQSEVRFEVPASGNDDDWFDGITDYSLYLPNGEIIALIEAKRQSRSPQTAREQAKLYAERIERNQSFRPFAFLSNGVEIWFWDTEAETPREVAGFFSREDLERMLFIN